MDTEASGSPKCALCENPLSADHVGRAKCGHEFHEDCIDNLIKTKGSCPGCKPKGECVNSKAPVSTSGKQATSTDASA